MMSVMMIRDIKFGKRFRIPGDPVSLHDIFRNKGMAMVLNNGL
jgi:hypothetical protein